ncbi:probable G-protein coupled receptor 139, partial [Chiloscyllium plagiosum]|uniref:probable G-protein coupled receptor 139 n=1 Tax=Chiloscyllium plagiosum TaxID=36176 RepID=UPI001CB7FC5F
MSVDDLVDVKVGTVEVNLVTIVILARANMLVIIILSRGNCGLSKCISCYLVAMAAADFLVVIAEPIFYRIAQMYFYGSFLFITPVCSFIYILVFTSTEISVWLTVAFTFDRFMAICCDKLKMKYCTKKMAAVVIGTVTVLGCLVSVAWYFRYEPLYTIDNIPWYCITKASFITSTAWAGFVIFYVILLAFVPFFLLLILNILTVRRILTASKVRRALRGQLNGENGKDPEMEMRRKSIILLFSISGSFITLCMTQLVFYIYQRITKAYFYSVTDPLYYLESIANMLQLLSTCTNTCIYVLTQNKFREQLKTAVKYPFDII